MSEILQFSIDGVALWVLVLLCVGVFVASFMDAIAGGGGIISLPAYMLAFNGMPLYFMLGTNKMSAAAGTIFSTGRYIKNGYVNWRVFAPAIAFSVAGSVCGTWLQLHTPDVVLKYLLLVVLPVVAFFTLRNKNWSDVCTPMSTRRRLLIVCGAALAIGVYDGYYGPGTGTFLMLALIKGAKLDARGAAGGAKVINLASNIGGLATSISAGYVLFGVGALTALASIAGHWMGAGLAIKNGSRIIRPAIITALVLLLVKVISELLFPQFWG